MNTVSLRRLRSFSSPPQFPFSLSFLLHFSRVLSCGLPPLRDYLLFTSLQPSGQCREDSPRPFGTPPIHWVRPKAPGESSEPTTGTSCRADLRSAWTVPGGFEPPYPGSGPGMLAVASRHHIADSELPLVEADLRPQAPRRQRQAACPSTNRQPARAKTEAPGNPVKDIGRKNATFSKRTGGGSLTDYRFRQRTRSRGWMPLGGAPSSLLVGALHLGRLKIIRRPS